MLPDPSSPVSRWLHLAFELCDAADEIAMRHFRRDLHIDTKPDGSLVTQADHAIETLIRERITAEFPDHGFVGEEYGSAEGAAPQRWYIDPIDGTHNYVRGIPIFATLLAVEDGHELVLGVVSAPALRARWFAWRGGGAWALEWDSANGAGGWHPDQARRLRVSGVHRIEDAQLLYSSLSEISAAAPGFQPLLGRAWRDRGFGDFWGYVLVAEGAADAMIEVGMHSWDLAPMQVLLEEAGGRLTDLDGTRTIHSAGALASNGELHAALIDGLRESPRSA